jgi:NAD(P)-dependent dehydrogenase (short-subunit alcohol dehydrogenase family)
MSQKLIGKVAVITGGTTGIGLATARRFIDEGATVIVTGRNPETLAMARSELGGRAEVIASDAADAADIAALFGHVKATHGGLDVLFLNAGVAEFAPLAEATVESFDRMWSVNVRGPWLALQAAAPVLRSGASVVLNTSVVHTIGMPGSTAYAATKAALRSLVRTSAAELSGRGIRVNAVSPGPIDTPIYSKMGMSTEEVQGFATGVLSKVPMARFGRPDEIANVATFLASDESSYVLGVEIAVDGGMTQI